LNNSPQRWLRPMLRATPQTPKNLPMKFDVFVLRQQSLQA
jgi:hypothetical protein